MRKLSVVLAVFLAAFSCSPEEQTDTILEATGCECVKETYELIQWVETNSNGQLTLRHRWDLIYTEPVLCQNEQLDYTEIGELFFKIICN